MTSSRFSGIERHIRVARKPRVSAMCGDDLVEHAEGAVVPVRRGRTDAPKPRREEHVALDEALRLQFVAQCIDRLVDDEMALEIAIERDQPLALVVSLKRLGEGQGAKVDADWRLDFAGPQRARHVVGRGIGEHERLQRQGLHVARGTADRVKRLGARLGCLPPIVGQIGFHRRRRQRRLERDQSRDIAGGNGIGHAAFGEVVAAGPADAVPLDRLHAVVNVERVDGELAQRREHALAAEGSHDQVGIDAVDGVEIDDPVGMGDDRSEPHALGHEVGVRVLARRAGLGDCGCSDRLQVRGHLARQKLDKACAHQRNRVPLARERRIDRVELRAFEAFGYEHIGDIVGRAADDRIIVATETGIGIRAAGAAERRIDAVLALGRNDRLRRLRPSGAVDGGELGFEQLTPAVDQGREGGWARRGDLIEIEMGAGRKDALVPTRAECGADDETGQRARRESRSPDSFHVPRAISLAPGRSMWRIVIRRLVTTLALAARANCAQSAVAVKI